MSESFVILMLAPLKDPALRGIAQNCPTGSHGCCKLAAGIPHGTPPRADWLGRAGAVRAGACSSPVLHSWVGRGWVSRAFHTVCTLQPKLGVPRWAVWLHHGSLARRAVPISLQTLSPRTAGSGPPSVQGSGSRSTPASQEPGC